MEISASQLGLEHPSVAEALTGLATLYEEQGDYAKALPLFEQSLAIWRKAYGELHPSVATGLNNLAVLHDNLGNYDKTVPLLEKALNIQEGVSGKEHLQIAASLLNLAGAYGKLGRYSEALPLASRSVAIHEKVFGPAHPRVADVLNIMANLLQQTGDLTNALGLYKRCLSIRVGAFGPTNHSVAIILNNLGRVYSDFGDQMSALDYYRRSQNVIEVIFGSDHPHTASPLEAQAAVLFAMGDTGKSIEMYRSFFQRQRRYLAGLFSWFQSADNLSIIGRSHYVVMLFHNLVELVGTNENTFAKSVAAEQIALGKAMLEEVDATRAYLEADPLTATQQLREQCQAVQIKLTHLSVNQLEPVGSDARRSEFQSELSRLEMKLAERVSLVAQAVRERNVTLADIARSLPSNAALLDFVEYRRCDFDAKTNRWKEQRYAAYLTFPVARDSTNLVVERVDIGEVLQINEAVEQIGKLMASGQIAPKRLQPVLQRLSDLVYAPMAKHLTNVSHLIICPDGQLSRVPFEMLLHEGKYLVETKTISYVTSGREIVRLASGQSSPKSKASKVQSSRSLVMGDPDFDFDLHSGSSRESLTSKLDIQNPKSQIESGLLTSAPTKYLSRSARGLEFTPLPSAAEEARSIAKLLGNETDLRLGKDAREAELKAVVSPRVLHLATHGFFLSDQEFKYTNSVRDGLLTANFGSIGGNQFTARRSLAPPGNDWENPLVRCGIALAGANRALQITNAVAEDGLLTGLEASLLNLQGTELVVLSACDSGTGEIKIGEGVMSLRRAFRIAGAETVLASHWKVSDKATSQLMTEFMRRWHAGEPRVKAWREAQLALLRSQDFSNPYFWAAFTLTGQWR